MPLVKMTKYLFIGNRKFVLEEMLKLKLDLQILVVKNTHLEKDKILNDRLYEVVSSKNELMHHISNKKFDVLISNGCPYILPIDKLKKKIYANIHPSYLPDLKGIDPCLGSILFKRDGGATCHIMDNTIDGGPIISRIKIPFTEDLDVSLMYQLSFVAEKNVFLEAYKRKFLVSQNQENGNWKYYSRKPTDKLLNFNESPEQLVQRVKTFNNKSQGCTFKYKKKEFKLYEAVILKNEFLKKFSEKFDELDIIFKYEDCIVFKLENKIIKLSKVLGPLEILEVGTKINKN